MEWWIACGKSKEKKEGWANVLAFDLNNLVDDISGYSHNHLNKEHRTRNIFFSSQTIWNYNILTQAIPQFFVYLITNFTVIIKFKYLL